MRLGFALKLFDFKIWSDHYMIEMMRVKGIPQYLADTISVLVQKT